MDNLLIKIKELVEAYNQLPGAEKMAIVSEKYAINMNIPHSINVHDVSRIKVCQFNENNVGLFKIINYASEPVVNFKKEWLAGRVFIGINSNYIALKVTHRGSRSVSEYLEEGSIEKNDDETYVANCKINQEMSFDDMRLKMYESGEINYYNIGQATDNELLEVLKYASKYFEEQKTSTKKKFMKK